MDAYTYASQEEAMDYLYDFFDEDLAACVAANRQYIPEGMEDLLAEDSLEDFVWVWLKDPGPNGFLQFLRDGGFDEEEIQRVYRMKIKEWAVDNPPHVTWFREDGSPLPKL